VLLSALSVTVVTVRGLFVLLVCAVLVVVTRSSESFLEVVVVVPLDRSVVETRLPIEVVDVVLSVVVVACGAFQSPSLFGGESST